MRHLVERGLMFGGLVRVDSPALVDRYRRALKHLTGKDTAETAFHVDISGYSPEIGDELGDDRYLNHDGVNRQFILLTTAQKDAPLLNAEFSTSRGVLEQFIAANEQALFALTARDAVAGELVNSHYGADTIERLLDSRVVTIEADTTRGAVAQAGRLTGLIDRFKTEPDGWWDDALIAEMIAAAEVTGDLARNPVALQSMSFEQPDFWTSRFGGLYVVRSVRDPFILAMAEGAPAAAGGLPVIHQSERARIARLLTDNRLVAPVLDRREGNGSAILKQKMDFIAVDVAAAAGALPKGQGRRELRAFARARSGQMPPEWQGLAALVAWAEDGAAWPKLAAEHPAFFYGLRAAPGPLSELVNMMLAEMTPLDTRQLYIVHKEAFYRAYATWPEAKRVWVADMLASEYAVDKAGTRAALFGPEPGMTARAPDVGPWGRVSRIAAEVAALPPGLKPAEGPWDPMTTKGPRDRKGRRR